MQWLGVKEFKKRQRGSEGCAFWRRNQSATRIIMGNIECVLCCVERILQYSYLLLSQAKRNLKSLLSE